MEVWNALISWIRTTSCASGITCYSPQAYGVVFAAYFRNLPGEYHSPSHGGGSGSLQEYKPREGLCDLGHAADGGG